MVEKVGSLRKDVFEWRTLTGSEAFSLFICLDANKFVLLSFFSLIKTIYPRVSTKPLPCDGKSPLPVDVRRSKKLLIKLPSEVFQLIIEIIFNHWLHWRALKVEGACSGAPVYPLFISQILFPLLTPSYPFLPLLPQMQTYWKHNILVLSLDFKRACSNYYVTAGQIHFIFAQRSWKERYNIIQSRCAFFALWFI